MDTGAPHNPCLPETAPCGDLWHDLMFSFLSRAILFLLAFAASGWMRAEAENPDYLIRNWRRWTDFHKTR